MDYLDFLYFVDKNGKKHPISDLDVYDSTLCTYDLVNQHGQAFRLLFLKYTDGDKVIAMPQIVKSSVIEQTLEEVVSPYCDYNQFLSNEGLPFSKDYYYQMANLLVAQMQVMYHIKKSLDIYDLKGDVEVLRNPNLDIFMDGLEAGELQHLKKLYNQKSALIGNELEVLKSVYNKISLDDREFDKYLNYFHFEQDTRGNFNIILNPAYRAEENCTTNIGLLRPCNVKDICLNDENCQIIQIFEKNPDITYFYSNTFEDSPSYELEKEFEDEEVYTDGYDDDDLENDDDDDNDKGPRNLC